MSDELKFLIDVVKGASLLITEEFEVHAKGNKGDLVTNFDFEIEKYIIDKIKQNYPNFSIISEEYNSGKTLTNNCFTIDPIDGTINFANNVPLWGIQVACIKEKKTCAAVIYIPKMNELFYADENGAFLNNKPIKVNLLDSKRGLYSIEGPNRLLGQVKMKQINPHCRDFFCAAINYAWVACGRLSATIFRKDSLWDYVPGQYIVEKAGGVMYNENGAHIAANNNEFLNVIRDNALSTDDERVVIVDNIKDK